MNSAEAAIECLVESTTEYAPIAKGNCTALLDTLGIHVQIKELQTIEGRAGVVFISEFTVSLTVPGPGMTVTCVGFGDNLQAAIGNAVGQWGIGVLPVVAHWRGQHTCISAAEEPPAFQGRFHVLAGPVIARGSESGDSGPAPHVAAFANNLLDALGKKRLAKRIHWLETFAVRHKDGAVDATCRLNNHNWSAGRRLLMEFAGTWPIPNTFMRTCRQFTMLLPQDGETTELVIPTLWNRIMGSA